jgi:predicted AlkP superfamily phosphohydrolase/phosphomutase
VLEGAEYDVDVRDFRTDDKAYLLEQIYAMTAKRFKVLNYLQTEKEWDFFMWVEMGVDRIHHGLWRYHDPEHHRYEPGNPFENAIRDYYKYIDTEIGPMLERLDDDTIVMVVSDHGAKRMDGGFCLNQWLYQEGYLTFEEPIPSDGPLVQFEQLKVDWHKTQAWGSGGYYGRLFLNVEGREPNGTIPQAQYEAKRQEIAGKLEAMVGPDGQALGNHCFKPEAIYKAVRNVAPDLLIYFGNLHWRSVGSLGHPAIYTFENDTGPDDANHAQEGLFIYFDPKRKLGGKELTGLQLMDIAPTILETMGVPVPTHMQGHAIDL